MIIYYESLAHMMYVAPEEHGDVDYVPWPHMRIRNKV